MNIGIDGRLLSGKMNGISRYVHDIIDYLPGFDSKNKYFLYTYEDVPAKYAFYKYVYIKRSHLPRQLYEHYWLNFKLPALLKEQEIDIFFNPYLLAPPKKGTYKNVITIHDAISAISPEYFGTRFSKYLDIVLPLSIKNSDAVLTVSESSKRDIIKAYNVDPKKIFVAYPWSLESYKPMSLSNELSKEITSRYNLPRKYIFYVGAIENRKNISGILRISDILKTKGIDIKFVLAGSPKIGFKEIYKEIIKREDRIIYLKYVEEADLPLLYNMASIFIFPTYYEGFGLPPLEAMKCGVPVLSSANSSLFEVVGNGGILHAPDDHESFANDIIKLLTDSYFYNRQKEMALQQAKTFSPEIQVPKIINLFNNL